MTRTLLATAVAATLLATAPAVSAHTFAPYTQTHLPAETEAVAIADIDGDGRNELLVATGFSWDTAQRAKLYVFRMDVFGHLVQSSVATLPNHYPNRMTMVTADVDGDGTPEAVAGTGNTLSVVRWDGDFPYVTTTSTALSAVAVSALDLNRDGRDEIVLQSWSSGAALFRDDGVGGLALARTFPTIGSGYNDAGTGLIGADLTPDWVVASGQGLGPQVEVFHGDRAANDFAPQSTTHAFTSFRGGAGGVAVGDVTADGADDIVVSYSANSPYAFLATLAQNPDGTLSEIGTVPSYDLPRFMAVRDVDGNGTNELLVLHHAWGALSVYQTGPNGPHSPIRYPLPFGYYDPTSLAVGDLDGDGCADVAVAGGNAGLAILRGQDCAPPPTADLALTASIGRESAQVQVRHVAGTTSAIDTTVTVVFERAKHHTTFTGPSNCLPVTPLEFTCSVGNLAVGDRASLTFMVGGPWRSAAGIAASVRSTTPDPALDNNTDSATR